MKSFFKAILVSSLVISFGTSAAKLPEGWIKSGSNKTDYQVGVDEINFYNGGKSAFIKGINTPEKSFSTVMQSAGVEGYKGKRIQLTAHVKTKGVEGKAGLWFRIDGGEKRALAFDNMDSRPIKGDSDWASYSLVLDVPNKATGLAFGLLLSGNGTAWVDSFEFTEVDKSVPVTDMYAVKNIQKPKNLDFETD